MVEDTSPAARVIRVSALIGKQPTPVKMYLTSVDWARLADEVNQMEMEVPGKLATPRHFKDLLVGNNLLVINSGTEDESAVNLMNAAEADRISFQKRRIHFQTGRA